jgi:hypothetical protein
MSEPRPTLKPEHFDALYAADPDPWNFAASPYERAKYTLRTRKETIALTAADSLRRRAALAARPDSIVT